MDDNLVASKLADLQQYVAFLTQVISNLKNNNNDKPRPQQLQKMEMLLSLITNNDKKPLKLDTLVKCETVVQKIYNKIEKQKDDSSNSSPVTIDSISTVTKSTDNQEIIEITEPDSPPNVDPHFHALPIVIPTERKDSPPPSSHLYKGRKMNRWEKPISEFRRDDELTDNSFRKRNPTVDRSRCRNNDRITPNYANEYRRLNENEIYDNRRSNGGGFESERRNLERNSRCDINNEMFDMSSNTTEHFRNSSIKDLRNLDYQKERHLERNDDRWNRYNLKSDESNDNEFYNRNDKHSNFSENHNTQRDNYYRENVRHNVDDTPFGEWLKNHNASNQERYNRETIDFQKTTYDYKHDSRNINNRESPARLHRDLDRTERIEKHDNTAPNWDIDDDSPDRAQLGPLTSFDSRRINLMQVPIKGEKSSQAITKKSKSNDQLNNCRTITSKLFDNIAKTTEESDNSIFNRLGNKIDMSENFQIKVKNDRAIPIAKPPLMKDVLKSPPLSAHDIDELYHESGGEVTNSFKAVRKKLAKISSKIKDDQLSRSPINSKSSSIKSPDPNRLAYKYNPHPRLSLDDPLSPKSTENTISNYAENNLLKTPIDPRLQKQIHTTNTLPSVNPNDPRLKTFCSDLNTQIPSSVNSVQNSLSVIPSLLDLNIPPIFDYPNQSNDVLAEPQMKPVNDVLDVDKNIHSPSKISLEAPDCLNYKKFYPLLNDQVERIKYLESKKNKPSTDTTNKTGITYREHRQKTEEDKGNRKDSLCRFNKVNKDKSRDKDIKNNEKDRKTKDSDIKKVREKSIRNGDANTKQFEFDQKYEKSKAYDNIGNIGTCNQRSDGIKILPNCLDSMYRTSNYKKDLGSVASFKIPKKGKDEDKDKSNEQEILLGKTNNETEYKIKEKTKNVELCSKEKETSINSTATDIGSKLCKKADVVELNDIQNQPVKKPKDHKIKINLLEKSSEILSPSSVELDSDDNWVVLSEIGTEYPNEESAETEENNSVSDKESLKKKNMEVAENIESTMDEKSKAVKSRKKSGSDIVVSTDNSEVSTQNIITGKRRNRSLINLNENLLAISKVQLAAAEAVVSDQRAATPVNKKGMHKSNVSSKSKSGVNTKRQKKVTENLSSQLPLAEQTSITPDCTVSSTSRDSAVTSTTASEDTSQTSLKKEEISKDSLESFLLDMLNPTTNKSRVLGMLAKVLDEKKFEQVKKIIEDDDTDNKKQYVERTKEESICVKNESELSVNITESSAAILKQDSPGEKRKQKKKLTELDRLNVDIRDMFISKGVITATGRRMCTMMNAAAEERAALVDRPSNQPIQCKLQSKEKNTNKKKSKPNISSEYIELTNLKRVPKVVLSKVDISAVGGTVRVIKNRTNSKRRKKLSWSKGIISRKSKKLAASKKATDNVVDEEGNEKIENNILPVLTDNNEIPSATKPSKKRSISNTSNKMPVLQPITPVKSINMAIYKEKPCPKSKKKFNISSEEDSILIGDEPIIDNSSPTGGNSILFDPSMPVLVTIPNEDKLIDLPNPRDLLNVTKLKNVYPGMHAKSEYSNKCVLCKFTGTKVANHYTANHPDSEVFISRLPPDTLKDLLANKNNRALYSFRKQQSYVYHYRCPFCDIQQSFSRKSWIDHFSTHTGEYAYKCSTCNRSMNIKNSIMTHLQNVCSNGQIILRPSLNKDIKLVEAFVCKLCRYVQMLEKNVEKHLKDQHDISNGYNSYCNRIILINIQNIPLLAGNEEQQQVSMEADIPKTNMDFIHPRHPETDKLDAFVPKEQSDISLDKNFLNYMDDMTFSTADSSAQILGKSSIIDQLSERLQSNSGDICFDNSVNCSDTKPLTPINRRYSIADQLSKRFKNADQQNVGAYDENIKLTKQTIENSTNNDGSESPIPVVYILDSLDDDIDNVEVAESTELLSVAVDKSISNKLNDVVSESYRNSDKTNSDKKNLTSTSIIARLNERFKSPQKKQISKTKEILQEKVSISRSGTMIIDRLNKRLNSIDDREKPENVLRTTNSSHLPNEMVTSREKTQNEPDDLMDTSDDKRVIDANCSEESILNEVTGILYPAKTCTKENEVNNAESSELTPTKDCEVVAVNADEECSTDDDDWEDIEIMPANFDSDAKSSFASSNNATTDKNKNGTFYQTLSRLYAASIKSKNKSVLKNKKSLLKNKILEEKRCNKKSKINDIIDISSHSPVSYRLPDFVTDAIPSPVSNELTVNPPVPLPSEPLSDLNDISEILEPSIISDSTSNNNDTTAPPNLGSPVDLCNIDDDDIFILNDETNIEDALALAAETGDDLQNEIEPFMINKTASVTIAEKMNTQTSEYTNLSDQVNINNININKNEMKLVDAASVQKTIKYRIDKLGFSITDGKIKYLCLVKSCSFLYSELEIGLHNHYLVDHPTLTWDGFCYSCESIVCFDDPELPLTRELKHMTEVHINNIKKNNNPTTTTTQNQVIEIGDKPKISLRRLSGDTLSVQPTCISLNEDEILQSNKITKLMESTIFSPSKDQATYSAKTYGNKTIPISQKGVTTIHNTSIKKLLNTPSVPPPLPATLSDRSKSPIILNNQLAMGTTKDYLLQNRSVSGNVNSNSLLKRNLDKLYRAPKIPVQSITRCTLAPQPIKNNTLGGSNLVISSVAEGVCLSTPLVKIQVPSSANEVVSLLKIQSVCSLNSNQTSAATVQQRNKTSMTSIVTKSPVRTPDPVSSNQTPLTSTVISTSNECSTKVGKEIGLNIVQPWFSSGTTKSSTVTELQLRPISLYALYKCMSSNCFFTTNCSDKLSKHFICHEFSGATKSKLATLESNINYRDWLNCPYCKHHADNSEKLIQHIKVVHLNDIYQCPYCFYRSCCESNVQEHQKIYHLGKKPLIYVAFGDRKKLALEIRFLAKNRAKYIMAIPCQDCSKKFYLLRNYITHIKQYHNITSETYTCGICKVRVLKKNVSSHLSATHNISIYQCIYCNMSSGVRSRMILHMTDEHPVNLLYSCVRVSPNKNMDISEETIENSTVLANLAEPVDPSILVECSFTIEQLNFMSPSLDAKSLQDNRYKTGALILTTSETGDNNPSSQSTSNLEVDTNIVNSTTAIGSAINSSINTQKSSSNELLKSPITLKISASLQNCSKIKTSQSIIQPSAIVSLTNSTNEHVTNSINKQIPETDKVLQPVTNTNNINEIISNSPKVIEPENDTNLNDRIIKAAKELVQDTGYEGYDLYRCAYPECVNIKITETTLVEHIQQKHSRVRSLKCPHCTSQYQSSRTLRHHLNTHRIHKYFCYFCNYTAISQQIITKHINDSHSKNANIITVPLPYAPNSTLNKREDSFYVTCPSIISPYDISQYGERLIRICERKKSLTKKTFKPDEIDQLPMQSIFHHEVICSQCNYKTKVRINMYRHLLYHTKEVVVPSIDPVNPVPCLISNEKHYDKMINLACSSNINKDSSNSNNEINNGTSSAKSNETITSVSNSIPDRQIPVYIPTMKRYVCDVNGCNYLTITDSMLKHHLNALHLTEKSYKCSHCKIECVKKLLCPDKIIQHLKFHDSKIFVCSDCPYMHYQKHLVERHIYEKHPNKTIDLIRYERTESDTIIFSQSYCGTFSTGKISTNIDTSKMNNNINCIDDDMAWECTICKHKTINSMGMSAHVSSAHNIRFRYACLHCKFGAGQFKTVMEHITDKHPTKDRKVKCAFNRVDETPVVTEDFLQQDNRPLWSRGDPHRVKNIRGILMEEEDESITPILCNDKVIPSISNNRIQENILKKSKPSTTTSKPHKADVQIKEVTNEKCEMVATTGTSNKANENSTDAKSVSNITAKTRDIYECSYCAVKNIKFKTIYTHWMSHHVHNKTIENKEPLVSRPFSFKLWGFMSQESSEEIQLNQITQNDLDRLKRLGKSMTRYQCNQCWHLFNHSSSVTSHQKTEHTQSSIKPSHMKYLQYINCTFYLCNFCSYASLMACETAAHVLNHYGGLKNCNLCNLKFDKFIDFVCHLPKHNVTLKDFIESDCEILILWNNIKVLYPNGLCIQRNLLPDLNNKLLEQLVIEHVDNIILAQDISTNMIETDKEPTINEEIENNTDKEDTETVLSIASESESIKSANTVISIVSNERITGNKKPLKKHTKDNEWMPGRPKKRKIESETETESENEDETESDDDLIPLKYLKEDNKIQPLSDSNSSTIIVPIRKPGPKCMQQKPYSFYGLIPEKINLKKIFTTMKLGNDKPVVISCENFAHFVNIEPKIYLQKLNINEIKENESIVTYKRKLSHLINNIIDEQLGFSAKRLKETK